MNAQGEDIQKAHVHGRSHAKSARAGHHKKSSWGKEKEKATAIFQRASSPLHRSSSAWAASLHSHLQTQLYCRTCTQPPAQPSLRLWRSGQVSPWLQQGPSRASSGLQEAPARSYRRLGPSPVPCIMATIMLMSAALQAGCGWCWCAECRPPAPYMPAAAA